MSYLELRGKSSYNKGFTLIEILVVFTIIAILSGLGFASFVSYSRSQLLNQSAGNIKLLISQARANSLSVVKSNTDYQGSQFDCGSEALYGYSVVPGSVGSNQIGLEQECANMAPQRIDLIVLPTGLKIGSVSQGNTQCTQIHFDSLSATPRGVPCDIVIEGFNSELKTIRVDVSGTVRIL